MRSIDERFYKNRTWKNCQSAYMKSVNGLCEVCLQNKRITPAKIVHHIVHLNSETVQDEALAYGFDNLQAVCLNCHNEIHFGKKEPKRYQFIDGQLVIDTRS